MVDNERNVKERIKFKVEIIAPEEEESGFGSFGGVDRSSVINDLDVGNLTND